MRYLNCLCGSSTPHVVRVHDPVRFMDGTFGRVLKISEDWHTTGAVLTDGEPDLWWYGCNVTFVGCENRRKAAQAQEDLTAAKAITTAATTAAAHNPEVRRLKRFEDI